MDERLFRGHETARGDDEAYIPQVSVDFFCYAFCQLLCFRPCVCYGEVVSLSGNLLHLYTACFYLVNLNHRFSEYRVDLSEAVTGLIKKLFTRYYVNAAGANPTDAGLCIKR
jgi:hypothetical protein